MAWSGGFRFKEIKVNSYLRVLPTTQNLYEYSKLLLLKIEDFIFIRYTVVFTLIDSLIKKKLVPSTKPFSRCKR